MTAGQVMSVETQAHTSGQGNIVLLLLGNRRVQFLSFALTKRRIRVFCILVRRDWKTSRSLPMLRGSLLTSGRSTKMITARDCHFLTV